MGHAGTYAAFANTAPAKREEVAAKYALAKINGHDVTPCVFEVFGSAAPEVLQLLEGWGRAARSKTPLQVSKTSIRTLRLTLLNMYRVPNFCRSRKRARREDVDVNSYDETKRREKRRKVVPYMDKAGSAPRGGRKRDMICMGITAQLRVEQATQKKRRG